MIIFFDFNFFNAEHTYMSSKSSTFVDVKPVMLTYSWPLTSREFNNMLIFSTLRAYKVETHNLEVLGSSPRWPTFKKEALAIARECFFLLCYFLILHVVFSPIFGHKWLTLLCNGQWAGWVWVACGWSVSLRGRNGNSLMSGGWRPCAVELFRSALGSRVDCLWRWPLLSTKNI